MVRFSGSYPDVAGSIPALAIDKYRDATDILRRGIFLIFIDQKKNVYFLFKMLYNNIIKIQGERK